MTDAILTINGGSSSIKFAVFSAANPPQRLLTGQIERIGLDAPMLRVANSQLSPELHEPVAAADFQQAIDLLIDWIGRHCDLAAIGAVGHRVVHGGEHFCHPQIVSPEMIEELKTLCDLDPDHMPQEIALMEAFARRCPALPQVACFDTAFHHDLPKVAQMLPVPRRYLAAGVRRYGFHGISFGYLLEELARVAGQQAAEGRLILAHLGSGASLAAVSAGKPIDTTMAFTPTAGLMMGTRCGDLDPGLLIHLLRSERLSADALSALLNHQSGLLGVSETSSDLRDLLARQENDPRAADAVALFCYQAKKWIGAMAAALAGVDTLVFSGGIGENAPQVRASICAGLEFLGVRLDASRNAASEPVISSPQSAAVVRVIRTDEQLMIVREVRRVLAVA